MITLLICAVMGLIIGLILTRACDGDGTDMTFGALFGTLIGLFIGVFVAIGVGSGLPTKVVLDHETELVALKDNSGITGSFFLGCGSIGSNFYYVFYEKSPDGKIRFNQLLADGDVSIVEEDRENGVLQEYRIKFAKNSYKKWGLRNKSSRYEIHIPTGSVLANFKLDLE